MSKKSAKAVSKDLTENPTIAVPTDAKIMDIPCGDIVADEDFNSRMPEAAENDEGHSLEGLADSIKKDGQLSPVLVAQVEEHPGKWFLVFGFRRYTAISQILKRQTIRATIYEPMKKGSKVSIADLLYINLVENEERKQLNPFERARRYHELHTKYGESDTKIASRIGLDRSYVNRLIHAYQLPKPIVEQWKKENSKDWQQSRLLTTDNLNKLIRMKKDDKPDTDTQIATFEKWLNPAPAVNPDDAATNDGATPAPGNDRASLSDLKRARAAILIALEETPKMSTELHARLTTFKEAIDWALKPKSVTGVLKMSKEGKVLDFRG